MHAFRLSVLLIFVLLGGGACTPDDPIEQLIEQLRSDFGLRREQACQRLRKLGVQALRAVPALRRLLVRDPSAHVRRCAADALGKMGPKAKAAIPELVKALRDGSGGVRMAAAAALGQMKQAALPTLKQLIHGKDGYMQLYATRSLETLGGLAVPLLQQAVQSRYLQVRQAAAEVMIKVGRDLLKHPNETVIARQQLLRGLFHLLDTPNLKIRIHVTWSLSELGPPIAATSAKLLDELLMALKKVLDDAPNQVKMYAAYALRKLGDAALKSKSLRDLLCVSKGWPEALQQLQTLLSDQTWYIRKHAASALAAMLLALEGVRKGKPRRTYRRLRAVSLKGLAQGLHDWTWDVRYEATRTLRKLDKPDALLALLSALQSKKGNLRKHIVQSLGWEIKEERQRRRPRVQHVRLLMAGLMRALRDPVKAVREAAIEALGAAGKLAAPMLLARLKRVRGRAKVQLLRVLSKWEGPPFPKLLSWLKRQLPRQTEPLFFANFLRAYRHIAKVRPPQRAAWMRRLGGSLSWQTFVELGLWGTALPQETLLKMLMLWPRLHDAKAKEALLLAVGWARPNAFVEALSVLEQALLSGETRLVRAAAATLARWPVKARTSRLLDLALQHARDTQTKLWLLNRLETPLSMRSPALRRARLKATLTYIFPALRRAQRDAHAEVRAAAVKAVGQYGVLYTRAVLRALAQGLRDRALVVRRQAMESLGWSMPMMLAFGWKEPLMQAAIRSGLPPSSPLSYRALEKSEWTPDMPAKGAPKAIQQALHDASLQRQLEKLLKSLKDALTAPSAMLRRAALFALGNIVETADKRRRHALVQRLLRTVRLPQRRFLNRNICILFRRWSSHHHTSEILATLKQVQRDPKQTAATRAECARAVHHLESDDKPYILWVDHPRSPTLEAFSPAIFLPYGP